MAAKLVKMYAASGVVILGGYYVYKFFQTPDYLKQTYCTKSIDLLNGYPPALNKLGSPIKIDSVETEDPFTQINELDTKVKLLVKGDKKRLADLFVYASRPDTDKDWNINTLEIKYRGTVAKYKIYEDLSSINKPVSTPVESK